MKKLEDLQVGDEVVFSTLIYAYQLGEVVGVTRAYIVVASYDEFDHVYYYNKKTGKLRGFSGCKRFMVQVATDELKEKAKKLSINRHTLSYLTNFNWYSLPYSKLKQIYNIIKSEEK